MKPRLAWVLGDPAGIGPELIAKSLAAADTTAACRPVVVGPMWLVQRGMQVVKVSVPAAAATPTKPATSPAPFRW
jgi:4-hydroxythreonine-4-phosphate dehydrogenase